MKENLEAAPRAGAGRTRARPRGRHRIVPFRRITRQTRRVAGEVEKLGKVALASAGQAAVNLRGSAGRAFETGILQARRGRDRLASLVSQHPTNSLLIAVFAGAILGFTLGRRR